MCKQIVRKMMEHHWPHLTSRPWFWEFSRNIF